MGSNADCAGGDSQEECSRAGGAVNKCFARVDSVEGYLSAIDSIFVSQLIRSDIPPEYAPKLWYRGQRKDDPSWALLPGIARKTHKPPLNPEYETIYLSKFKSYAIPYLEPLPAFPRERVQSYWGWLFLMQHYGVPTRLLDWSRDALAALTLAVEPLGKNEGSIDAQVWALNPIKLNEAFNFHPNYRPGYIPNVEEEIVYTLLGPGARLMPTKKPAAVFGPLNSTRIVAQKGVFTVFPYLRELTPLEQFPDSSHFLYKICVAKEARDKIRQQLKRYGFTSPSLFPGLDKIADQIEEEGY